MKKIIFFLLVILIAIATTNCKKSDNNGTTTTNTTFQKITIIALQTSSDSVVIKWTKPTGVTVYSYLIIRRNYKSSDPGTYNYGDEIEDIYDDNILQYTDHNVPTEPYLEYEVIAHIQGTQSYLYSNVMTFKRPDLTKFYLNIRDVIPDVANHRCFIIGVDSGKITLLDYVSRSVVKTAFSYATLGYSDIGTYNGVQELYVPRNDGWVYIYNASTLDKIDQVNTGSQCYSVVYNNGKLFISAETGYYQYSVEVIDRTTKTVISTINNVENSMHLKMIPGSTTKLFGISSYDVYAFEFDANGNYVSWNMANSNYGSSDSRAFGIFPDGQYFITSNTGAIYSGALAMIQQLPYGNYQYSGFTFNSPFTQILASCSNYKNIIVYNYPGYSEQQTYHCMGYPMAIFIDNANIISLSSLYSYPYSGDPANYLVESIPMSKKAR